MEEDLDARYLRVWHPKALLFSGLAVEEFGHLTRTATGRVFLQMFKMFINLLMLVIQSH